MKKVIVTGANGFIGSNLIKKLYYNKVKIYAIVRNKEKAKNLLGLDNVNIIECKMCDYSKLNKLISEEEIDTFYHFAWDGHSGDKRYDYELQLSNIKYTCDAIKSAKILGCKRFVFPGSLIEYEYKKALDKEFYDVGIGNIYGIAKITARNMGQVLSKNLGIDFIPTTISNVYGVGEKADRLFKSTLKKLISGEKTSFTECEQMYDFIYIDDAAEAFYLIGENGKSFKNYYIGNIRQRKLKKYICDIRDCVDKNAELGFGDIRFKGISLEYTEFDTYSLYNDFKFEPKVGFIEGVLRTKEWLEKEGI